MKEANDDRLTGVLLTAITLGYEKVVVACIEQGADVNAKAAGGMTPLHLAVIGNCEPVVSALLASGADPKGASDNGETPLDLAKKMRGENNAIVQMLRRADIGQSIHRE